MGAALLIHGAGGGGWEWRAWARVLAARGVEPHAPDLAPARGGLADTGFDDYRNQVVAHGRALAQPLVLAGASLGGLLALAACEALRPRALVLVNPVPPAGVPGWPVDRREARDTVPWGDERDFEGTRRAMPDCDHAARVLACRRWRNESGRVMAAIHDGIEVRPGTTRTLVIAGVADPDVPVGVSRALAGRLAADWIAIPGASHLGPLLGHSAAHCARLACDWLQGIRRD